MRFDFPSLIKWLWRKFSPNMWAVQVCVLKLELRPGMRESQGHLFPTYFYETLGIMQACSWQINTRPYEVAVPAELQKMRGTAIKFSLLQFAASDAFVSHDPNMYGDFPLCQQKCFVTTLNTSVGTHSGLVG